MDLALRTAAVIRRTRTFFAAREPGQLLVLANVPPAEPVTLPPLHTFDLDRELGRWLDLKLAAARAGWEAKAGLDDDALPSVCPHFGIAEHSAWLGMAVQLQEATCLPVPIVHGPADLARLVPSEAHRWYRYMREGYDHLRRRQDGTFYLGVRGTMAPMDLADAVRGNDFYLDVVADTEFAHQLVDRLTDLIPWYYDRLVSWADAVDGGHVFLLGNLWLPAGTIGHLSNDAATLCGPEIYAEFGWPSETRLLQRYRSCFYHVHNLNLRFVPRLAELPGLLFIEATSDPKTTPPIDDLAHVFAQTGHAALMLSASSDQVRRRLDDLRERNIILNVHCRDRADAADIIKLVRDRSRPLAAD